MPSVLSGVRVIDLTVARAGPASVRQLADFGADVIRIEMPDDTASILRDHDSSDYLNLHPGKRLINLNLKSEQGLAVLMRLLENADVLVENFRPAVKQRLGIDHATLAPRFPRLVYASISGFGQDGPRSHSGAVDQIIQGVAGLMSLTGDDETGPYRTGIAVSDLTAGTMLTNAILMALMERDRSGLGQWVQVSLLEALLSLLDFQAARWTVDGENPGPVGNEHPTSTPMGMYRAADGHLNIAAPSDRLFRRLTDVLGPSALDKSEYAAGRDRHANRDALRADLEAILARRTRDEWLEVLDAAGIPCGPVNTVAEAFADAQVRHLGMTERVEHPQRGPVEILRSPITMSRTPRVARTPSPAAGQHTDEILQELGYSAAEVAGLRADGVV
jgi:crotonobetainyl-CoA:carnitine CoA-transferase CaiB-like acyl-CoA transferase